MNLTLTDNRSYPGFGTIVVLLYAMYAAYIASLYILEGDKGSLGSKHFLLFLIVISLLFATNTGKLLIARIIESKENIIIIVFLAYMAARLLFTDSETLSYYMGSIFIEMGTGFIAGFIAFSVIRSRLPVISNIIRKAQSAKHMIAMALLGTAAFIGCMIYFLTQFLGGSASLTDILQIRPLSNDFYQDFGDPVIIGYCCLVSLQVYFFKRNLYTGGFLLFAAILSAQTLIAFICSQAVDSNKSAAATALIFFSALYFCKPPNWLICRWKIKTRSFYIVPVFLFILFLLSQYLPLFDTSRLRILDRSDSIFISSSIESRWQLIEEFAADQFMAEPMFGDPSISPYMHSSLMSVQTHFGFIGSVLFWSFMALQLRRLYGSDNGEGMKAITLPIIFISIISSFFSWGPLWFLIGALYANAAQS